MGAGVRVWGPCTGPVAHVPCGGLRATGLAGGVWVQAPPLPCCPHSGRAAWARWPRALGAGVGVCGVCGACAVCAMVRGVAFRLSLWCPPLRCFVAVLCSLCACRAPFPARVPCLAAGYHLFPSWLRRSLPFPLLSVGPRFSLACTFSLPPPWCVSRSFSLPARLSLLLGPVRQRRDGGMWAFGGFVRSPCNILYPRRHHDRCGCVLRCAAYSIPVFALVSTCVRTLFTLRAIPWCACPWRWRLCCARGDRPVCSVPTPPSPALMAYREREAGGFLGAFSVGGCGVVYFALVVRPWSSLPRGVCGGGFVLPRHALLVYCLCACGHPYHSYHPHFFPFGLALGIPSYHSRSVPRRWRPLVLHSFIGGVHVLALAASSGVDGL